jgi:hypothetical protein
MNSCVVEEDSDDEVKVALRTPERLGVERDAEEVSIAGVICVTRLLGIGGREVMMDVCATAQRAYRVQRSSETVEEIMRMAVWRY